MQKILLLTLAGIVTASLFALPAQAAFTTVNITSYVNRNVFFNPSTFPTGLSYGNRGTGVLFDVAQFPTASGVAGIWNVGTRPDVRGRGIGRETTLAALRDARAAGHRLSVLGSSPMGLPVYTRIGFVEVCRIRHFGPPA